MAQTAKTGEGVPPSYHPILRTFMQDCGHFTSKEGRQEWAVAFKKWVAHWVNRAQMTAIYALFGGLMFWWLLLPCVQFYHAYGHPLPQYIQGAIPGWLRAIFFL